MDNNLVNKININFKKMSFFKKFSFDIWITIIIIIVVVLLSGYFNVLANLKSLREKWYSDDVEEQNSIRCNPSYMIFANIISSGKESSLDTFRHCQNSNLDPLAGFGFAPFTKHFSLLNAVFTFLYSIVIAIKGFFIMLYNIILSVVRLVLDVIENIYMEMYYILIVFSDTIKKILLSGNIIYYILVEIINIIKITLIKISRTIMTCIMGPLISLNHWVTVQKVTIFTAAMIAFISAPLLGILAPIGYIIGGILLVIFSTMCGPSSKLNKITISAWQSFIDFNMSIDKFGNGISTIPVNLNKPIEFNRKVIEKETQEFDKQGIEYKTRDCKEYNELLE
tara:strand:- start:51 stop:1064 length:1014 start_codon:yes stop_codon:yes gene_type:complete